MTSVWTKNPNESRLRVDIEQVSRWKWRLTLAENEIDYVIRPVWGTKNHAAAVARRWIDREEY